MQGNIEDFIEKIDERILKMDDFIKAMLEYSRVSRMGLNYEEVNIEHLIKDCLDDLEFLDGFGHMDISPLFINKNKSFKSDRLRTRIIFGNIISNAYKYRDVEKEKSHLNIKVDIGNDEANFEFTDNGIGISPEYLDKVFDMFFRATEKSDGSGLGMYIVKQSIDKLNGEIEIQSKLGQGTTFAITIPCH
jgi:signal transduction histidine kinase